MSTSHAATRLQNPEYGDSTVPVGVFGLLVGPRAGALVVSKLPPTLHAKILAHCGGSVAIRTVHFSPLWPFVDSLSRLPSAYVLKGWGRNPPGEVILQNFPRGLTFGSHGEDASDRCTHNSLVVWRGEIARGLRPLEGSAGVTPTIHNRTVSGGFLWKAPLRCSAASGWFGAEW
jgi:hypothetical protein